MCVLEIRGLYQRNIKYLGVKIDWQGTFGEQVKYVCKKAEEIVSSLNRILPNMGGPSNRKRRVLVEVVESIILYAAPIWYPVLRIKRYEQMLVSCQRKYLIRVCSAYRTISVNAVQVIAGIPPITFDRREEENYTIIFVVINLFKIRDFAWDNNIHFLYFCQKCTLFKMTSNYVISEK